MAINSFPKHLPVYAQMVLRDRSFRWHFRLSEQHLIIRKGEWGKNRERRRKRRTQAVEGDGSMREMEGGNPDGGKN